MLSTTDHASTTSNTAAEAASESASGHDVLRERPVSRGTEPLEERSSSSVYTPLPLTTNTNPFVTQVTFDDNDNDTTVSS